MRIVTAAGGYEWDVAVSFANEDRPLVEAVVRRLQADGVRVFYDRDQTSMLWGANLVDVLHSIYRKRARYAILFISRHYVEKNWTNHERQSIQERALLQRSPYLLPVRLDDTEVPGLPTTIGHLDARRTGPVGIAREVLRTLAPPTGYAGGVPDGPDDIAALLDRRPAGWECLLYAGVLRQGFAALEDTYLDHRLGMPHEPRCVDDDTALRQLTDHTTVLRELVTSFERVMAVDARDAAFGPPGTAGQPDRIMHLGRRLVDVYRAFLDWSADVRAVTVTDPDLRRCVELTARFADDPIQALRAFVAEYVMTAEWHAHGDAGPPVLRVTLPLDEALVHEHTAALAAYCASIGLPPAIL